MECIGLGLKRNAEQRAKEPLRQLPIPRAGFTAQAGFDRPLQTAAVDFIEQVRVMNAPPPTAKQLLLAGLSASSPASVGNFTRRGDSRLPE